MLFTYAKDDFVEGDSKTKTYNADVKKSFSVCIQWAGYSIVEEARTKSSNQPQSAK